jgi:hypothetical protein
LNNNIRKYIDGVDYKEYKLDLFWINRQYKLRIIGKYPDYISKLSMQTDTIIQPNSEIFMVKDITGMIDINEKKLSVKDIHQFNNCIVELYNEFNLEFNKKIENIKELYYFNNVKVVEDMV